MEWHSMEHQQDSSQPNSASTRIIRSQAHDEAGGSDHGDELPQRDTIYDTCPNSCEYPYCAQRCAEHPDLHDSSLHMTHRHACDCHRDHDCNSRVVRQRHTLIVSRQFVSSRYGHETTNRHKRRDDKPPQEGSSEDEEDMAAHGDE